MDKEPKRPFFWPPSKLAGSVLACAMLTVIALALIVAYILGAVGSEAILVAIGGCISGITVAAKEFAEHAGNGNGNGAYAPVKRKRRRLE